MVRTFDFTPLMRQAIGFDHLNRLFDAAGRHDALDAYPPYNIEKTDEDHYRISMAVAGFRPEELDVTTQENTLYVRGRSETGEEGETVRYLHRGIAKRAFERRFELADTIRVTAARVEDGLLHVDLVREVPEAKKPRTIPIGTGRAGADIAQAAE
jgi:molecular chaperone IbpA